MSWSLAFHTARPIGYGRLIIENETLLAIREEKDASEAERAITYCNGGLMAMNGARAREFLDAIGNANAKGEYYLTDVVEVARAAGARTIAIEAPETELMGCNNRAELAAIGAVWQGHQRHALMILGRVDDRAGNRFSILRKKTRTGSACRA
ncbi:hypothetical protein C8J38_1402 [Rhizobium sp. PP-WC-2G-219]|nr:hypothetical protein C8J38_1402 [Rhizobium sp. PP-WC-2G-219]